MSSHTDSVLFQAYRGVAAASVSGTCLLAFSSLPWWFKLGMVVLLAGMHIDFYKRHLKPLIVDS